MQYRKNILYRAISAKTNLDENYIKILLTFITDGIKNWSKDPDNLILSIKYFGKFYWRHKKLQEALNIKKEFTEGYNRSKEHSKFVENSNLIIGMFEQYIKDKEDIKKKRYGDNYMERKELKKHYENITQIPI